jgi:hypothetical protein
MMFRIVFWDVHGSTSQKTILNNIKITFQKLDCGAEEESRIQTVQV